VSSHATAQHKGAEKFIALTSLISTKGVQNRSEAALQTFLRDAQDEMEDDIEAGDEEIDVEGESGEEDGESGDLDDEDGDESMANEDLDELEEDEEPVAEPSNSRSRIANMPAASSKQGKSKNAKEDGDAYVFGAHFR
jgi:hypothetical protein